MPTHDIVVIGFSAGGIDPLQRLVADLPSDFPASIFVVHHFPPMSISALPSILNRSGSLPAVQPSDGDEIVPGRIYVARPDHHLLVGDNRVRLTRGPREHSHRPAIDPLFRTAARSFGPRVIGVILSGTLDDGTAGLLAVKQAGGLAVVQDPEEAAYPGMSLSALRNVPVDHVARAEELGALLDRLARLPAPEMAPAISGADQTDPADPDPAVDGTAALRTGHPPGQPSPIVCPECGGVLWETGNGGVVHFRCHVGHAYTAETLLASQSDALESALWRAVRALEEKAELSQRLANRSRERGMHRATAQFESAARSAEQGSDMIRESLLKGPTREALETPTEAAEVEGEDLLSGTDLR
jgi:two-component system, chemotaxis family, protein-glutamate methylesterase/glutaminase